MPPIQPPAVTNLAERQSLDDLKLLGDGQHVRPERGEVFLHGAACHLHDLLGQANAVVAQGVLGLVHGLESVLPRTLRKNNNKT